MAQAISFPEAAIKDRSESVETRTLRTRDDAQLRRRSLNALRAYEATARLRTFTAAATLVAPLGFIPGPNKLRVWLAPHLSRRADAVRLVDWLEAELRGTERWRQMRRRGDEPMCWPPTVSRSIATWGRRPP